LILLFTETMGTEGRAGYFDQYGIIRDVVQNHLLQILAIIAMDAFPVGGANYSVRDAKARVLKHVPEIIPEDSILGQYDGYKSDPTIGNLDTITPTYACMRCWVNSVTWKGVPFVLEAGKGLDENVCEARLHLRGNKKNALVLRLQPVPSVFFSANLKTPGFSKNPVSIHFGVTYGQTEVPGAYARLLLDVCRGCTANFVRDDELLLAWKIFTPFLKHMESEHRVPASYSQGSLGPGIRLDFLRAMGVAQAWLSPPSKL